MAILSLLARLGSADPVELRGSLDELARGFDITRFGAAPTKFDTGDLRPLTARHLHALPFAAVADEIDALGVPSDLAPRFWEVARENIETRAELAEWWRILKGERAASVEDADTTFVADALALLGEPPYDAETWSAWTSAVREATGRQGRRLFMPLRLAVTGRARGPEMADLMPLLQKKPTLQA
jgi:glutamyl-tRNA synthetase